VQQTIPCNRQRCRATLSVVFAVLVLFCKFGSAWGESQRRHQTRCAVALRTVPRRRRPRSFRQRKMLNDNSATAPLPDGSSGKAPTTTEWAGVHRMKGLLSPPTLTPAYNVEISIHKPPRMLRRDIELVFRPDLTAAHAREAAEGQSLDDYLAERLIAVPTWQPSKQAQMQMQMY
jgi:hypothetical protein